jgi:GT2 family glycosyltransferase
VAAARALMSAGVTALVINFNTAELTRRATRSLLDCGIERILVLDNASTIADFERLQAKHVEPGIRVMRSEDNLGFAAGSNRLIDEALRDEGCDRVLLLNSDAFAEPEGVRACLAAMREGGHDLMGARMNKPEGASETIDSLGIAMYRSLLASNRKSVDDAYLGPTGGFAVYSRRFLEEVKRLHGCVFDESYFCYAEDTDLCLRARLLGFSAGYSDATAAHHAGQGSSEGQFSEFILYHGIRNSVWMVAKSMPAAIILTHLPWILALHAGIVLRHTRQGHWRTVWRLYRDAFARMGHVLRQRRVVQSTRRVALRELRTHIDPHFYETRFVKGALTDLFTKR